MRRGQAVTIGLGALALTLGTVMPTTAARASSAPSGFALAREHVQQLAQQAHAGIPLQAAPPTRAVPPAGNISANVEFIANVPVPTTAISIAFIAERMFVSSVAGIYSYDISDPTSPKPLAAVPQYIWENEHMTVDAKRQLLFVSRDPRGYTSPGTTAFPYGSIEVYDVSNPTTMVLKQFIQLPGGHTTTCINGCDYIWTGGPATGVTQPADWLGRPIFATDIRDIANPVVCATNPLDTGAMDGQTTYAHGIDVDANGVVWVSGDRHLRGFWTQGQHLNPLTGAVETADGCHPIPYAGGGTVEGALNGPGGGGVIHNSGHMLMTQTPDGRAGDVVSATEEVTVTDCAVSGRFLTYDLGGTYQGQGFKDIAKTHFRLHKLGTWTPKGQPGSTGCDSAHWFTQRPNDGLVAIAFYTQGTRFLDISDPTHIRQTGYYNVTGDGTNPLSANNTWAAYWHDGNYVYVADFYRGVDILRYHDVSAATAAAVAASTSPAPGPAPTPSPSHPLPNTATTLARAVLPWGLVLALLALGVGRQRLRSARTKR